MKLHSSVKILWIFNSFAYHFTCVKIDFKIFYFFSFILLFAIKSDKSCSITIHVARFQSIKFIEFSSFVSDCHHSGHILSHTLGIRSDKLEKLTTVVSLKITLRVDVKKILMNFKRVLEILGKLKLTCWSIK